MADNSPIIVQKYGGSSVADTTRIKQVAQLIANRYQQGARLCVVVSAMGKTTDQLLAQAHDVSPKPSRRELDMLLTCGERASMALLAMALDTLGIPSISFTGSQSGIITNNTHSGARIIAIRPFRVQEELAKNKVVIIAGFQGVSLEHEITTLGRGGSDTTAVAMAAALNAEACEIYSDVKGVYSADPRLISDAILLSDISIEDMAALSDAGAKVLNAQAVQFAQQHGISIDARATGSEHPGTRVSKLAQQTTSLTAIAHKLGIQGMLLTNPSHLPACLAHLAQHHITPQHILSTPQGQVLCCIYPEDAHGFTQAAQSFSQQHTLRTFSLGSVTLIGTDAHESATLIKALQCLQTAHISLCALNVHPRTMTVWLEENDTPKATELLHNAFFNEDTRAGAQSSQQQP